ncbi:uncharacterized protein LOC123309226 [Coccinella septempunctata]|uniref:uncharacterized protein LOC123309226 n=1 Tax=Coccinella septempunctata TaxID=41139 RepID=UPI001D089DCE|nr:uncharacterized protein LOC123309226 [Coccinella septempunctata]
MTMFAAVDAKSLIQLMTYTYSLLRAFGINPPVEKTILFPQGFGEYTSWYQDGDFIGQCDVGTSSLKPGGQNPQDDFNNMAALTLNLMRTYTINVMGPISRICIGINNAIEGKWKISSKIEKFCPNSQRLLKLSLQLH